MDTSILPHDQSFGQKLARESSLLSVAKTSIPRKRATVLWDRSLEDVIEGDNDEMEEHHSMAEEEEQKHDETQVLIGKEEYTVCTRTILRISVALSLETMYSGFPHLSPIPSDHLIFP